MNKRITDHPAVGQILPIGDRPPRWMYVTHVYVDPDGYQSYWGPLWVARRKVWTKKARGCARGAVGIKTPRTPRPRKPA